MSMADDILATKQAQARAKVQAQTPRAWRAGERHNDDGTTDVTSRPYDGDHDTTEAQLLRDHGYDPDTHVIVGGWRTSSWTAYKPKEYRRNTEDGDADEDLEAYTFTARAYKFKVAPRAEGSTASDVDDMVAALDKWTPQPTTVARGKGAFVLALGDLQVGKVDSPLSDLVPRFTRHLDDALARYKRDSDAAHVHIAWLGDCIEGVNSRDGSNRWRTTLTMTEQVRVLQRLMMYAVKAFAPHCERLTVVSVPGNHDEAFSRDLKTREDDSWAVQALVSVQDAIDLSERDDFAHVECYVPGPDQQGVTLDVGGMTIGHIHGHQFRPGKEIEWWQGQAFGGQDIGHADLLLHGHQHHGQLEEQGKRTRICVPAMETESVWWTHKAGTPGNPGSYAIDITDGHLHTIRRLT